VLAHVAGISLSGGLIGGVYMLYGALLIIAIVIRPDGVIGLLGETYQSLVNKFSGRSTIRGAH
jgi:hypothetical protein